MELDFYLFKNKIKHRDFAKTIGITESHLSTLIHKKMNPNILTIIKILEATKGRVSIYELVREKDQLKD